MVSVYCPRHGGKVLLSQGAIVGLRGDVNGYEVQWRCSCGETGATLIPSLVIKDRSNPIANL